MEIKRVETRQIVPYDNLDTHSMMCSEATTPFNLYPVGQHILIPVTSLLSWYLVTTGAFYSLPITFEWGECNCMH